MDRTGVVRSIAAVVGGVVVVMGAWSCAGDPTGVRLASWGASGSGGPGGPSSWVGTPAEPVVTAQEMRVRAPLKGAAPSGPAVRISRK